MTQTTMEELKKEFKNKFGDYIKNISIGQYDDKGVNIGFLEADEVVWSWIERAVYKAREDGYEVGFNAGKNYGKKTK